GRDPAGLERVAGIGTRADLHQAKITARVHDGLADLIRLGIRSPDLETRSPRHAMAQAGDLAALDVDDAHIEALDLGQRAAVELLQHLRRVRALDLIAVGAAHHRLAARP